MNPSLSEEALEFGATAGRAFAALGGVDAARRAEDKPELRTTEVAAVLASLGVDEIDARHDEESLAAAAALCVAAGRVALPYPVAGVVLRDGSGRPFSVGARVDHGDLFPQWVVASLDGCATVAAPAAAPLATRLGPFVTDLRTESALDGSALHEVLVHLTLTCWQVLGTVERAVELAVEHVTTRVQFGRPLSAFQAVQFQLADAAVAAAGLRELAHFTLWRLLAAPHDAATDVLALRVHALDVARAVLRTAQQLHGASGVCDEYDISVLCRHAQPVLRLPFGAEQAAVRLADAVDAVDGGGFDGLFPHGGAHRG